MEKEKYVVYKMLDHYCVTSKSNYDARISNEHKINHMRGFDSAIQVINHLCKYYGWTTDEFIIVGDDL